IPQPPGNVPLTSVTVTDTLCSPINPPSGDANGNGEPDLTETWTFTCTELVQTTGTFTHDAVATGGSSVGSVRSSASLTIQVQQGLVTVPDVRGYTLSAAEYDLKEAKLSAAKPIFYEKSDVPVGQVVRQDPQPGARVAAGTAVMLWVSEDEPRHLFIDPPRTTISVDEQVVFEAFLVTKDREVVELDPTRVQWTPGPSNIFRGTEAGEFTVTAMARGVSGSATVIVEEEERTRWDRPISSADDLTARVPPPPPDAFTWYALCNRATGDVVYGETTDPVQYDVLAGPFQGPRDVRLWIDQNLPSWRCPESVAGPGRWNVLCDRRSQSVRIGTDVDFTRDWSMASGFVGEPEARAWVRANCPSWVCEEGGACASEPRAGGNWAVVCSKDHGGMGLTRDPDPTKYWIFTEGLFSEKDARAWVNLRCPSWRCDRDGQCVPGVRRDRDRPLELPPDLGDDWFTDWDPVDGDQRDGDRRRQKQPDREATDDSPGERPSSEPTWQPPSEVDCSALREQFQKRTDDQTNEAKRLNCEKNGYSGCALDVAAPFFPWWPARVFSDEACAQPGYAGCMSGAFSGYLGCLDGCNSGWRNAGQDLRTCHQKCNKQIEQSAASCTKN
ncbi:MAG: PASTA domain-containing protein, partial [Acidobacteriota bacterium]